ncbi:MAG: bifunctional DNA-formamidopyrimidine glycosylase/DNA-(apurinic or apyrimidinic site) lyase [Trebonia sp.]
MPELPEVETVRAGLERHVVGRTVATALVLNPRAVRRDLAGPDGFAAAMADRTFLRAERRGKYLWLALGDESTESVESGEALLAHLGMSGQLLVGDPGLPLSSHVRARFTFTDGGQDLRFTDQRTFGHLMLCGFSPGGIVPRGMTTAAPRLVPAPIAHIAPDPLEPAFDPELFAMRLARRKTQVKRALLDQSLISGIGNIYADEALWRAKLHWARPTETLGPAEASRLLEAVRDVLTEALKAGGTSFDALYVNVNGESGYFDRSLNAYGREGKPCGRCATPIRRDAFMNRSAYSCPRCQRSA